MRNVLWGSSFDFSLLCGVLLNLPFNVEGENSHFDWSKHGAKWHATANADFKAGNARNIGRLGFNLPVSQSENSLLFHDFRGRVDDHSSEELNIGLVYRTILDSHWIFGAYGYFDRVNSAYGNEFHQGTFGVELLSEEWDFRINGYLPDEKGLDAGAAQGFGSMTISGSQIFVNGQRIEERAYYGVDYEVGKLLKSFGKNNNELRLFGGGYYFDNDEAGFAHIAGPRVRLEARLFDVPMLGEGFRVTLSGEVQWDRVRDTQAFAGIGVQIPLGKWGKRSRGSKSTIEIDRSFGGLSRLERRMYDPVVRDVDVVTNTAAVGSAAELALDAEGDALFVASNAFPIGQMVNNAGPDGTIAVNGLVNPSGTIQLQSGQRLTSVTTLGTVVGSESGRRYAASTFTNPVSPGIINIAAGAGMDLINAANSVEIRGLDLITNNNTSDAIRLDNDDQVRISDLRISTLGDGSDGITSTGTSRYTVDSSTITTAGNASDGIQAEDNSRFTMNDTIIVTAANSADGIESMHNSQFTVNGGSITTTGGVTRGVRAVSDNGFTQTFQLNGVTIVSNGAGVFINGTSNDAGTINATISNSSIVSSGGSSEILLQTDGTAIQNLSAFGNSLDSGAGQIRLNEIAGAINVTQGAPASGAGGIGVINGILAGSVVIPGFAPDFNQPAPPLPAN